jgi:hypothetical protein
MNLFITFIPWIMFTRFILRTLPGRYHFMSEFDFTGSTGVNHSETRNIVINTKLQI